MQTEYAGTYDVVPGLRLRAVGEPRLQGVPGHGAPGATIELWTKGAH
jgi:hypothetical protein